MSSDVAVPISRLADIIDETRNSIQKADLLGSTLGHVGDGNFHTRMSYGEKDNAVAEKIISDLRKLAIEWEGIIKGEYGTGLALRDVLKAELGENAVDTMRKVRCTALARVR